MPSSSVVGATTTLPPSSSLRTAVAGTSSTWTTKTADGGRLPPVQKMPPEGWAAPGTVIRVYDVPSGANDQPEQRPIEGLGRLDVGGADLEPGYGVGCGHDDLHKSGVLPVMPLGGTLATPLCRRFLPRSFSCYPGGPRRGLRTLQPGAGPSRAAPISRWLRPCLGEARRRRRDRPGRPAGQR